MQTFAPKQVVPTENKRVEPLSILKASKTPQTPASLTLEHIAHNTANRVVTSFIPDANVILRIQDATDPSYPATDTTLAHFGLLEYTHILRQCVRNNWTFSVSPIFAFSELPKDRAALALQRYYAFGQRFGIDWKDDPQASTYPSFGRQGTPSIWTMTIDQRSFLGMNYAYQLLMLVIRHTGRNRSPMENFALYLREVLKQVQIMSTRDIAVAMYLFASPRFCDDRLKSSCSKISQNFGKHDDKVPTTLAEMDACALNSAYDLQMANFANLADTHGTEGVKLDNWIVTGDEKLVHYMDLCHNVYEPGYGAGAKLAVKAQVSEDGYFQQARALIDSTTNERQINRPTLPTTKDIETILLRVWDRSVAILAGKP